MFDFAWSEIGVIGLLAVLLLGPKELPTAMRAMGRFTRQARKLAGEFQSHVNELVREAELDDVKRSVEQVTSTNVNAEINKLIDPANEIGPELDAAISKAEAEMRIAAAPAPPPAPSDKSGTPP